MSNTENPATSPELLAETLHELERAELVIKTMLNLMSGEQKARMADALEAAHIATDGATRYHERRAVIERADAALKAAGKR